MNHTPAGILEELVESNGTLVRELTALRDRVAHMEEDKRLHQEWYTLPQCAALKGISQSSLREHTWLRPLGGRGRHQIAGWHRWPRDVVAAWLHQDDEELRRLYGAGHPEGEEGAA